MNAEFIYEKSTYNNFITILKNGKVYIVNKKDFLSLFYSKVIPEFYKNKNYSENELNDFSNSLSTLESIEIYNDDVIRLNLRNNYPFSINNHIVLYDECIYRSIIYSFKLLSTK